MTDVQRENLMEVIVGTVIVAALLGFAAMLEAQRCTSTWQHSGMPSEWKLFAGCLVQTAEGRWIPASNYRELP